MKEKSYLFKASIIFIILLLISYYIHISFFSVNVVFYASIFDAMIATLLGLAILAFLPLFMVFNRFEKLQLAFIWLLAGYIFAISIPTVIDRSLSFYILEKLQQRNSGLRLEKFEDVFTKEYLNEHHLVEVRLTEQKESGIILIENNCVKLTQKGNKIASLSRFFRQNFLPKKRLLLDKYSDDLTDPFRYSNKDVDYLCN